MLAIEFVYPNNLPIRQTPIDNETEKVIIKSFDLIEMGIHSLSERDLIRIDYSEQGIDMSAKSFKDFKSRAAESFLEDNFIISKYKQRIDIYCIKQDSSSASRTYSVPALNFMQKKSNVVQDININYSLMTGGILKNKFLGFSPKNIIDETKSKFEIEKSIIITISKIEHTINLPRTKLLANNIKEMVLPGPVFRIDSTDYIGDENFFIELNLDKKTPIKHLNINI